MYITNLFVPICLNIYGRAIIVESTHISAIYQSKTNFPSQFSCPGSEQHQYYLDWVQKWFAIKLFFSLQMKTCAIVHIKGHQAVINGDQRVASLWPLSFMAGASQRCQISAETRRRLHLNSVVFGSFHLFGKVGILRQKEFCSDLNTGHQASLISAALSMEATVMSLLLDTSGEQKSDLRDNVIECL